MSVENLIQYNPERSTPEQRRENARKAGLASGVARQKRKKLRDVLANMMTFHVTEEELRVALETAGYEPTHENAIGLAAIIKASHGDIEAARFVRDTLGEKPTESFNLATTDRPIRSLDLSGYTDADLEAIADGLDDPAELPPAR